MRLPADAVEKIDRASEAMGVHKKDLIAGLVTKYVDPDSRKGRSALGSLAQDIAGRKTALPVEMTQPPRGPLIMNPGAGPTLGAYSFQAYDAGPPDPKPAAEPEIPEVMNVAQCAKLLQVDEKILFELAESGKLPGRKLGYEWRFSRAAILAWLAGPEAR